MDRRAGHSPAMDFLSSQAPSLTHAPCLGASAKDSFLLEVSLPTAHSVTLGIGSPLLLAAVSFAQTLLYAKLKCPCVFLERAEAEIVAAGFHH